MAGHRLVIQEMMIWGYPPKKIHILQEKDTNKMGRYTAYLMNLMTGPKGCLLKIVREIWMRRHWYMSWLGHNEKPNIGNDQRMTLQSVIEKCWIM